ncbi:AMP-binding protein [Streptomyces aurantiacus]|uniref:Putative Long-chain-fatty-acid--CoA ligase n=1 Tax=Streptomyces aurantiacus JA 4570 TaxID=1286094 RepID=S3ZMY8_9ACTN|nr:AMP-binding protein [Streptomyces aurantiacus]EPH39750.1 putative Long-chain-fatty-acid--CoA ligase [Streptomyces aurantiacus JA 4570]
MTTQNPAAEVSSARSDFRSYVEAILDVLADDPARSLITTADGRQITAGAFRDSVHRMARELAARGIGRGTTVSLLSRNRPEVLAARYAANLLGARLVFLYDGMAPGTLAHVAESVDTELLLLDPDLADAAERLLSHTRPPHVLSLGPGPYGEDLLALSARRDAGPVPSAARPDDDWCIRHTGGTTGVPKGVRMAHGPYKDVLAFGSVFAGEPPRFLAATTLAHVAGNIADATFMAGGSVVLQHSFDAAEVLAAVERERITHLWLLPPLLYRLLDHPALGTTDLSSILRISYGGCAASPSRLRQAHEVFGPVLFGGYGQSEVGHVTVIGPDDHKDMPQEGQATVGRVIPGVEVAIHGEDGTPLPAGRVGEIRVRSGQAMTGYWEQPELTAEVLREGWIHTGDMGHLDEEGFLYIADRLKDMIIVVGGHVYTHELEDLLHTHPAVAHCAVFGARGADAGEEVHVAAVPAAGQEIALDELRDFVTRHKGTMYAPARLHLLTEIPLTPVGKPDKKQIRATLGA